MRTKEKQQRTCRALGLLLIALLAGSCNRNDPEAERRAAVRATLDKLSQCAPATTNNDKLKLAIAEIMRQPSETSVRLVAYATSEQVDFHLPVYLMSRGRWLINEQGRAYLLDESCREYKLKDRKSTDGQPLPLDGKRSLKPGEAVEFRLSFPRLPDETRLGMLVYGSTVIPFSLLPAR
jgi:hypothetical protein